MHGDGGGYSRAGKFSGVLKRRLTLEGLHEFHEPRDRLSPFTQLTTGRGRDGVDGRDKLCSTSTECARFIVHLSFETDVGAHTERSVCAGSAEHHYARGTRREMDLRGSRPDVPFPSAASSAGHDSPLTKRLGTRVSSLDVTHLEKGRAFTVGTEERKMHREGTIPCPLLRFKTCAGSWDDMRREMDVRETSDESKHQRSTV
ncbi:uncharacterized protein ARMOST_19898 [Armillaria ostoyae]|uniref:Uncharacterized protein n=1 Tax=Armillaria ostoyae TaxID=47428 RepID=A0A284S5Y8_ARMOS|nr:uncharacterized protein ARMOST_19898 [Armillaria ostoyae]